jgi:dihydrofolate reductase
LPVEKSWLDADEFLGCAASHSCEHASEEALMRLTATIFVTMDGVIQGPGAPHEDPSGEFGQGGWLVPYADDDLGEIISARFAAADAFLLGRRTYELFAAHWPHVPDDNPVARALNRLTKYVVSATITDPAWRDSTVISGDVVSAVTRLKALPGGELQVHGSPQLVRSLLADELIDEYQVLIYPVVLGHGRRIFDDPGFAAAFRLAGSVTTRSGVAVLTYLPAGKPRYGSFASDPEPEQHRILR